MNILPLFEKHYKKLAVILGRSHTHSDSYKMTYRLFAKEETSIRCGLSSVLVAFEFGEPLYVEKYDIEKQVYVPVFIR